LQKLQAYYNAGSAALVFVLIMLAIGTFLWCHFRRRQLQLPTQKYGDDEESIPLTTTYTSSPNGEHTFQRKGKEKEVSNTPEAIFDVGEIDEEEDPQTR
jgi:carboxypeptidase D